MSARPPKLGPAPRAPGRASGRPTTGRPPLDSAAASPTLQELTTSALAPHIGRVVARAGGSCGQTARAPAGRPDLAGKALGVETRAEPVRLTTIAREWGRIGCTGFGGPPTHIAMLRRLAVEREGWLDEAEFEDPGVFDVGRDPNRHLSFGRGGPHLCLGAHLARLEVKIVLAALARRVAAFELAGEPRRIRSNVTNGLRHLPIRVTPA